MQASGIEKVWICKECIKEMRGPGTYIEDPGDEFKKSKIEKLEYEQISFL